MRGHGLRSAVQLHDVRLDAPLGVSVDMTKLKLVRVVRLRCEQETYHDQ